MIPNPISMRRLALSSVGPEPAGPVDVDGGVIRGLPVAAPTAPLGEVDGSLATTAHETAKRKLPLAAWAVPGAPSYGKCVSNTVTVELQEKSPLFALNG